MKWFNSRKGYGVIMPTDGGFNVFINVRTIERAGLTELKEGQTVHFDVVSDNRTGRIFAKNLSVPPAEIHFIISHPTSLMTNVTTVSSSTNDKFKLFIFRAWDTLLVSFSGTRAIPAPRP